MSQFFVVRKLDTYAAVLFGVLRVPDSSNVHSVALLHFKCLQHTICKRRKCMLFFKLVAYTRNYTIALYVTAPAICSGDPNLRSFSQTDQTNGKRRCDRVILKYNKHSCCVCRCLYLSSDIL